MSNYRKISFVFILAIISFASKAQNFQKVFRLNGRLSLFNAIEVGPNHYLVSGSFGPTNSNQVGGTIVKLKMDGSIESVDNFGDSNEVHYLGFSHSDILKTDDSSSICWHIVAKPNQLLSEYIFQINSGGEQIWHSLDTTLSEIGISTINGSDNYFDTQTNKMYTLVVIDKSNNSNVQSVGVMVSKMDKFHTVDWRKFLLFPPVRYYSSAGIFGKGDKLEVIYNDLGFPPNQSGSNSKVHFVELDTNGTILRDRIFQPFPFTQAASGVQLVNNGQNYLMMYSESKQGVFGGQNTVIIHPVIALLDSSLNIVWKDSLDSPDLGADYGIEYKGNSSKDYVIVDSNFVFARMLLKSDNVQDSIRFSSILIDNRQLLNGEINWRRDFRYYNNYDTNISSPHYELYDATFVPWDSGYVFVGTSYNYDSLNAGVPGQLGYVLKTNCLGHLGDPIAGASYTFNDSLGVHFQSTSIQDGSVTWHFGDGVTEKRGEYQDSVFHQYNSSGTQEIILVAHGCLGITDTLRFTIEIPEYIEPIDTIPTPEEPTVVYTKTLTIGPNPTISGEPLSVYLGDLPESGATLVFIDQNGKHIQDFFFPSGQSMYLLPLSLAAGIYELVLYAEGNVIDRERLLVR